jgi:uncharacterized protein
LKNGANGIQLGTNVNGRPIDGKEFWPLYEVIAKSGRPILLHPARTREMPDYEGEDKSKYRNLLGAGLAVRDRRGAVALRVLQDHGHLSGPEDRLASSRRRHPYLEGRVAHSFDQMGARTSDEDYEALRKSLKKRPYDYFKDFYADTAIEGVRAPMICGIDFFGADRVLFASDCPIRQGEDQGRATSAPPSRCWSSSILRARPTARKICFRNAHPQCAVRMP